MVAGRSPPSRWSWSSALGASRIVSSVSIVARWYGAAGAYASGRPLTRAVRRPDHAPWPVGRHRTADGGDHGVDSDMSAARRRRRTWL